ncbi:methyltransferase [Thermococcus sp. P6]|uniref:TasA family protein n=1 Tax=Thermococcus sp. P6 TaxID=122420 RepID=UPI000B59B0C4|nr:TasA family protein [Thermococcus sp. P6]ASJ10296.1 methyltransferase [Thermococcus sp. P6]
MRYETVVAVGILATLLVLSAPARSIFTDVAKSQGNEFGSGEFDIGISKDGNRFYDDLKLFEFSDLKPGDERTFTFYVKNRGEVDVSRLAMVFDIEDLEDGMSSAEEEVDNTPNVGELSGYLTIEELKVYLGNDSWSIDSVKGKSLRELNGTEVELLTEPMKEDEILRVSVTVKFSREAGNECQTDKVIVNVEFNAEQ